MPANRPHYPIILYPYALQKAEMALPEPRPFSLAPPESPDPAPLAVNVRALLIPALVGGGLGVGLLLISLPWGGVVLGVSAVIIAGLAGWQRQTYPRRLQVHKQDLARYQVQLQEYETARQAHAEQERVRQTPEGLQAYRQERRWQALTEARGPDGEHDLQSWPTQGASEAWFFQLLAKAFPGKVSKQPYVEFSPDYKRPYTPDITLTYPLQAGNLLIDIEIDEPYTLKDKKPTHFQGNDDARNDHFRERGWVVIRFTEAQVIRSSQSCIKQVAAVLADLTQDPSLLDPFVAVPDLELQPQWTEAEALEMAQRQVREPVLQELPSVVDRSRPRPAVKKAAFEPSVYQQAIYEFVRFGTGDGLVTAVAGSGKSTTLVQSSHLVKTREAIFVAFNVDIAAELEQKLAGRMDARTLSSLGLKIVNQALGKTEKDDYKYHRLIRKRIAQVREQHQKQRQAWEQRGRSGPQPQLPRGFGSDVDTLKQAVDFCRLTLTDAADLRALQAMCGHYSLPVPDWGLLEIRQILKMGQEQALKEGVIDFTDMIWLPIALDLEVIQFEWIFADECQDFNACQLELILKCRKPGGRILFVGDPKQAIYGFTGADSQSVEKIKQRVQPTELPLSICYRCPVSHLDLARELVPHIEARPHAPTGLVGTVPEAELAEHLREGDMILCRLNGPLVQLCIQLVRKGVKAQLRGADLGNTLVGMAQRIAKMPEFEFSRFLKFLQQYESQQLKSISNKSGDPTEIEEEMEAQKTQVGILRTLYRVSQSESLQEFCSEIQAQFEHKREVVILTSVHKAKGLEAERVFIYRPKTLPLQRPEQQIWEKEQEMNLKYVALTRGKQDLYMIE
jgi:DNA helicase-2/ATP-dependent DNA helicase PcrA